MNYGVTVKSEDNCPFYGVLQEVVELLYFVDNEALRCVLFRCDWFDPGRDTVIDRHYKLVDVDSTREYPTYDPYIMSYLAEKFTTHPTRVQAIADRIGGLCLKHVLEHRIICAKNHRRSMTPHSSWTQP